MAHGLRQLSVQTRCTNRDLPVFLIANASSNGFTLESGLKVDGVRLVAGRPAHTHTTRPHNRTHGLALLARVQQQQRRAPRSSR